MNKKELDWKYFDWQEFQALCLFIAETLVSDCNFSEYLKQGQKQEGLDIISLKRNSGKFFCIQCKREKELSEGELKKIIAEFRGGQYFENSSHFFIATSADLQKTNLQIFLNNEKLKLFNEYGLEFDVWDKTKLEAELKKRFDLVAKYFGEQQAKEFCLPKVRYERFQKIQSLTHYIPRKLVKYKHKKENDSFDWSLSPITTHNLIDLITKNRSGEAKICIIGDSHHGKSSYIRQTIFQIQEEYPQLQPIYLQIRDYNIQAISELLTKIYGEWRNIPSRDLILIIDGLDEVPTEKFDEAVKQIKEFSLEYCAVSIVFSCRKLFYIKYNVASNLPDFETYDLFSLQHKDVDDYIDLVLGGRADDFKKASNLTGISGFLFHPFYLVNIVEEYNQPPYLLPDSKLKVTDSLINRAFNTAQYRKVTGSEAVKDDVYRFNTVVEKFAFALQLAGVNSFSGAVIAQLFNTDERLLLQHNSLVTHSEDNWGFINALFQEHIAARMLSKMSFQDILTHCTVGTSIVKVKTKWIQTISSLLSFLPKEGEKFYQIVKLIEDDNIELLFQTEKSKYDEALILTFLEKIITKCMVLNIRTQVIYEDTIGYFIKDSDLCKDYLLGLLFEGNLTVRIKVVCCRILRFSQLTQVQISNYCAFTLKELNSTTDSWYAANLVQVLGSHKYEEPGLIEKLISNENLNKFHEFRDKVYELITTLHQVDRFYDYAIDGLPYLINHNKNISHGGSERSLEEFLLESKNPTNLIKILKCFKDDNWLSYFERHSITGHEFLKRLFNKLIQFFESYPYMIFPIADLVKDLGKKYLRDELKEIDMFLEATNTRWLIVRILIEDIFKENNWEMGSLISYDCYDYILFEFEERPFEPKYLLSCWGGLCYKHKNEMADNFYKLCVDTTESSIINKEGVSLHDQYVEAEKKKNENDLIYIQSLDAFKVGLNKYFTAYGKNTIPEDDLFIDVENRYIEIRKSVDSNFLFNFLVRRQPGNKLIRLADCLKRLEKEGYFETFQAEEILNNHRRSEESEKILTPILESYYKKHLQTADFENCLWTDGNMFHWKTMEYRLGEIFKKFAFHTPETYLLELVWLDNEGIRGFKTANHSNQQSISQMILDRLSPIGNLEFRKKIVQNIKKGIKQESVLGTHISLCRQLKITESRETIFECLSILKNETINKSEAIDTYIELGGSYSKILPLFTSEKRYNDYFFWFLAARLYKEYPVEASNKLKEALNCLETNEDNKIKFAQILSELGDFEGFKFLVNIVRITHKAPYHIQSENSISKLDTDEALVAISDIMYLVVDKKFDSHDFHDSAKSIILEWLSWFASKSEDDLKKVISFLEVSKSELSHTYNEATDLNWYINRMLENFRNSDKANKDIGEVHEILKSI